VTETVELCGRLPLAIRIALGGATVLQAARQDRRFAAVIDLDSAPHDPEPQPFHQPVPAATSTPGKPGCRGHRRDPSGQDPCRRCLRESGTGTGDELITQ